MGSPIFVCPHCGAMGSSAGACAECGAHPDTPATTEHEPEALLAAPKRPQVRPMRVVALVTLVAFAAVAVGQSLPWLIVLSVALMFLLRPALDWVRGSPKRRADELYDDLLRKAHGDRALVERLVAHERLRSPGLDRVTLLRRVVDSWERDRP